MKRLFILCLGCVFSFASLTYADNSCELSSASEEVSVDVLSEALGHFLVRHLQTPDLSFNVEKLVQGITDECQGKPSPLSEEEYEKAIMKIQETVLQQTAERNLLEATAFLEQNASEEGIVSLNDKLQYKLIQEGAGEAVAETGMPLIHYRGSLLDGTVFASSKDFGGPVPLSLAQTLPGLKEGLIGMKEGESRVFYIHPDLAFGQTESSLPPNSLIVFEVEIVKSQTEVSSLEPAQTPAAAS